VRIISGRYKGRVLSPPKSLPVRPTTDFAKTALFNIVNNSFDIEALNVLDLFAGTGNISFEFSSRGAGSVTAVDISFQCVRYIRDTAEKLGMKNLRAIKYDSFKFITGTRDRFDLIFADPPYDLDRAAELPTMVFDAGILSKNGWLILEHRAGADYSNMPRFRETRSYGNVGFTIFENESKPKI
jgi:16S rRNA (guanine966-N2)-methyltransferase